MASKHSNNIRVMCRFRPMNEIEQSKNGTIIYKLKKSNGTTIEHPDKVHHPQPMHFYFDRIFDAKSAQVEIFDEAALPLIDNIFEGYNATIFAYGQTGSGKTHTMMGDMIKSEMHPRHGIIPRVVREIWNRIVHASTNYEFELKVSFLEIYNEQIYDLLSEDAYTRNSKKRKKHKRQKLIIREYSDQVFVENLNEIYVRDQNELFDLIKSANKHRISAETKMNRNSSRSHAVLSIILGQEDIHTGNSKKSKFCLVDLAGSEKVGKTQAKGIRLKEATSINKSLTTLGTCMNKLADNMKQSRNSSLRHIPFRESVLTRLLSDSLGGNCKTTLLINTSPSSYNVEETISTLRFGERAKKIKTKARINQIKTPQQYRKELQMAQTEIMKLYRIIEECAEDITEAFKGTLSVENCKSYKNLLDLKKKTLNILNGKSTKAHSGLLANILPDLKHLQSLKKVQTVRKQQKKLLKNPIQMSPLPIQIQRQVSSHSRSSAQSSPISKPQKVTVTQHSFDPRDRLRRSRNGSFEELNVDEPVKLVRDKTQKKLDPLKRKTNKKDFRAKMNTANPAFQPPQLHKNFWDVSGVNVLEDMKNDDGLSLGQMGNFAYNSNVESEYSDYNSEFDALGIMSPAGDTMSDTSNCTASNYLHTHHFQFGGSDLGQLSMEFTDFAEEELPKNFFEMSKEQRLNWAKNKRIDPQLIEYRYEISRQIDWVEWDSGDEDVSDVSDGNCRPKQRGELEREIDLRQQKLLMLCRLIRTKTQEYNSRIDIEISKYQSLSSQYRAKNEENSKLMQQNTGLEKLFERTENDKRELNKNVRVLKRELSEKKKHLSKLQKQLTLRLNELNIERQNQISLSNDDSLSRQRKKNGKKYRKKIESEIIRNGSKDINTRFGELANAFTEQSNKYQTLEDMIEISKVQIRKYEELMRQKDTEGMELRDEIENEDLVRKELILSHNLEMKKMSEQMKKSKTKADVWKRRAFVYKNAVNSLMEEAEFNNLNDDNDSSTDTDSDQKRSPYHLEVEKERLTALKPLASLSPRSMQHSLEREGSHSPSAKLSSVPIKKSPLLKQTKKESWKKNRKSRQSIGCNDDKLVSRALKLTKTNMGKRGRDKKYPKPNRFNNNRMQNQTNISMRTHNEFHMTPSQKTALTSVKMKIRGGGGSDRDMHKTPIVTSETKKIYSKGSFNRKPKPKPKHKKRASQPINMSLPPPQQTHMTNYSSDEYPQTYRKNANLNNKSRSPIPVGSISIDNSMDQSPSLYYMGRGKRSSSPLPPPTRTHLQIPKPQNIKYRTSMESDAEDSESTDQNEEFEEFAQESNIPTFLSPNRGQYSSPAGSFFDKIKHTANDDYKEQKSHSKAVKKAVSIPEPNDCTDSDGLDEFYSDYTDDNVPSYNKSMNFTDDNIPSYNKYQNKRAVVDTSMD